MKAITQVSLLIILSTGLSPITAQDEGALAATSLTRLPVREAMVFKDGHAFLLHEATVKLDDDARIVLDELPKPVLGTFWPAVVGDGVEVVEAVASERTVTRSIPANGLIGLIDANPGAAVVFTDVHGRETECRLAESPVARPSEVGWFIAKTQSGDRIVQLNQLRDLTFTGDYVTKIDRVETRRVLELRLRGPGARPGAEVKVALAYLQHGIDWLPSYRVDLDGKGSAAIELRAAISNDLIDLDDALVHLVVGVPSFPFAHMNDPISLESLMRESGRAVAAASFGNPSYFANNAADSNFFNTQVVAQDAATAPAAVDLSSLTEGGDLEDLFVHTLRGITLKKGERMSRVVMRSKLPYEDVYVLDLPVAPPENLRASWFNGNTSELDRLLARPKAEHRIRLTNESTAPITTAPALVFRDGRLLAQGRMLFAPPGAKTDLPLTTAIEIQVERDEREVGIETDVRTLDRNSYHKVSLAWTLTLVNRSDKKVRLEVERLVLGEATAISEPGSIDRVSMLQAAESAGVGAWSSYRWPNWWSHLNGASRARWTVDLEPAAARELTLDWFYYWR